MNRRMMNYYHSDELSPCRVTIVYIILQVFFRFFDSNTICALSRPWNKKSWSVIGFGLVNLVVNRYYVKGGAHQCIVHQLSGPLWCQFTKQITPTKQLILVIFGVFGFGSPFQQINFGFRVHSSSGNNNRAVTNTGDNLPASTSATGEVN